MENEIIQLNMEAIEVRQGTVSFPFYDDLKSQALELAANMENVEVNEETIKDSKKLLAAVNKRVKELEDRRIKIKRLMLEPYDTFEKQVKEIVGIVKEADETLRQQVRNLEEMDRIEKRNILESIFNKRKALYTLGDLIDFGENFLESKHLNKTQSIEKTEEEMIVFLEKTEKDVKVMQRLQDVQAHLQCYLEHFDLALAMTQVNQEKERKARIEQSQAVAKNQNATIVKTFTVYDEKDFLLVEMYMKNNRIKFTVEDGI
jgi:hypothetical protein